mmetsp:Transcript_3212/g.7478  ORF Transcript_3212/g.7478 Transcript_3212/m.7478 type:complete len:187 (-) Transcript_3212:400-960(-)
MAPQLLNGAGPRQKKGKKMCTESTMMAFLRMRRATVLTAGKSTRILAPSVSTGTAAHSRTDIAGTETRVENRVLPFQLLPLHLTLLLPLCWTLRLLAAAEVVDLVVRNAQEITRVAVGVRKHTINVKESQRIGLERAQEELDAQSPWSGPVATDNMCKHVFPFSYSLFRPSNQRTESSQRHSGAKE